MSVSISALFSHRLLDLIGNSPSCMCYRCPLTLRRLQLHYEPYITQITHPFKICLLEISNCLESNIYSKMLLLNVIFFFTGKEEKHFRKHWHHGSMDKKCPLLVMNKRLLYISFWYFASKPFLNLFSNFITLFHSFKDSF